MKICRFDANRVGLLLQDGIHDVTAALALPSYAYPLPRHDVLMEKLQSVGAALRQAARSSPALAPARVKLLSPVANPGKIIAAPVNYRKHLEEALADKGIHHGNLVNEITRPAWSSRRRARWSVRAKA